jgi:hypothetical protein
MRKYQFEMDALDSENFLCMLLHSINQYDVLIFKEMSENKGEDTPVVDWYRRRKEYEKSLYEIVTKNIIVTDR